MLQHGLRILLLAQFAGCAGRLITATEAGIVHRKHAGAVLGVELSHVETLASALPPEPVSSKTTGRDVSTLSPLSLRL